MYILSLVLFIINNKYGMLQNVKINLRACNYLLCDYIYI